MKNSKRKDIFILTGGSRGLGRAIANELAGPDAAIVLINRVDAKDVVQELRTKGVHVQAVRFDLAKPEKASQIMSAIFKKLELRQARSLTLVNCAGVVTPVGFAGDVNMQEALKNLNVNAVSPILLVHGFLNASKKFKGRKLIVNVSTGAARRPIAGWGLYCSAKAALEMFGQCVTSEQDARGNGTRVITVDPGALDTGMQADIRRQKKNDFPLVDKFIEWHINGTLKSPRTAAIEIVGLINAGLGDAR